MHRLFVGIDPPSWIKTHLLAFMGGVTKARWQRQDQLHLTLRFIGEVDRHCANDIAAALDGLHHPAFNLALSGIGLFDRRGRPHTLWVGVSPQEPVKTLHNKIDQAIVRTGIAPEGQAFRPHITIARLDPDVGSLNSIMANQGSVTSAPFRVNEICLYESQLTRDGPIYTIVERYPLD